MQAALGKGGRGCSRRGMGDSRRDCDSLSEITLLNSLQHIGRSAFSFCVSLEKITFPDGLLTIGASAFERCNALTEVVVPDRVTTIGNYAFDRCTALRRVTLPASVTSIGLLAFARCPIVVLTVLRDSFAEQWCKENDLSYTYPDANDWLLN